jgi:hypothetical protein
MLDSFFAGANGSSFTTAQQTAIAGYNDYTTCVSWDDTFANRSTATGSCDPTIPPAERWSATNPNGIICNSDEQIVNQLGLDPTNGFPNSPLDNVGVQYGLAALDSAAISPAQFATLNATIGGMNFAGVPVPQRTEASLKGLRAVYADDLVNSASLGLRTTPVIDQRLDLDFAGFGNDIHTTDWSFIIRARMLAANGTDGNQVIIENMPTAAEINAANSLELAEMDTWLTNIENDRSDHSARRKVLDDKPAGLTDGCFVSATDLVHQSLTDPGTGQCGTTYPVASNPRVVAGEPLTMPALKCSLKPLNFRDYPVTFSAAEKAELRQVFPTGVCDYNRRGVASATRDSQREQLVLGGRLHTARDPATQSQRPFPSANIKRTPISFSASESRAISALASASSGSPAPWRTPGRDEASASSAPCLATSRTRMIVERSTPARSAASPVVNSPRSNPIQISYFCEGERNRLRRRPPPAPPAERPGTVIKRPLPCSAGSLADAA